MTSKRIPQLYNKIALVLLVTLLFSSCFSPEPDAAPAEIILPTAIPQATIPVQLPTSAPPAPAQLPPAADLQDHRTYLDRVSFAPNEAKFYDLVTKELTLGQAEDR